MFTSSGHLTYCTNIHAGESWEDHFAAITRNFPFIKSRLSPGRPLGIGLRLSNFASLELGTKESLHHFKTWLQDNDGYIFTMNGFPYGGFHHTRVKDQVHSPDWSTRGRVDYTLRMFDILSHLLPEDLDGGISTSPLSYRHWFTRREDLASLKKIATQNILEVAARLITIRRTTGQMLHLDIEPEPDGVIESGSEFLSWFNEYLLPAGIPQIISRFRVSRSEAEEMIKAHIRLCYDVCHFSIGYEKHGDMLGQFRQQGIRIGKIQISAALKAAMPAGEPWRSQVVSAFAAFDEPTYLHQVVAATGDQNFVRYPDLPQAIADSGNPAVKEWRAHFHVPVFETDFGSLQSTRNDIEEVLELQKKYHFTEHLEAETYTWEVLPERLRSPLEESIARELEWVLKQL